MHRVRHHLQFCYQLTFAQYFERCVQKYPLLAFTQFWATPSSKPFAPGEGGNGLTPSVLRSNWLKTR